MCVYILATNVAYLTCLGGGAIFVFLLTFLIFSHTINKIHLVLVTAVFFWGLEIDTMLFHTSVKEEDGSYRNHFSCNFSLLCVKRKKPEL